MLRREIILRTAEDRAAYKRRLRVMTVCYGLAVLGGVASFALKPATTSASVTIDYPVVHTTEALPGQPY